MMKITQLKYFQAVCTYKNYTKAAEACFVSQPAISQAIKDLENQFSLKLFNKYKNQLTLTQAGQLFLEKVNIILQQIEETEMLMKDLSKNYRVIKIGIPPMIGALYFPKIFNEFKSLYPEVELEMLETGSLNVLNALENKEIELALAIINDVDKTKLDYIKILSTELVYLVSHHHRLAYKDILDIKEIDNEKVFLLKSDSYQNELIKETFKKYHIHLNVALYSNQLNTISTFLNYGDYGAFVFKEFNKLYPEYKTIPFTEPLVIEIGVIWNKNIQLLSYPKKFIQFVKEN